MIHPMTTPASVSRRMQAALASAAFAAALLISPAPAAHAEAAPAGSSQWELRVSSGALVQTGVQRDLLKDASLTTAQLSYLVQPALALNGTVGWARSRDLVAPGALQLDVYTYDVGAEARGPRWFAGHAVTVRPFVGVGAGGRSYDYRHFDTRTTHDVGGYASAGGEVAIRRVHLRLEARDYVTGFKPLSGGGKADTRNDVAILGGLRIAKY